jgi:TrmH family RNA methyltransferase
VGLGLTNQHVRRLRRLLGRRSARRDEGVLIVEGAVLVREAVAAGCRVECQFVAPGVEAVDGAGVVYELDPGVIDKVTDTETPPGIVAIVEHRLGSIDDLRSTSFVLVADSVADPGNLGTLVRSAEAAGVDAVVLTSGTVDVSSPKTVRASAGAVFHVPIVEVGTLADVRRAGFTVYGTSSHRGIDHRRVDYDERVAIVIGNEAHGIDDDASIDEWITIEHVGRSESLNAAMAGTLVAFEVARHRRGASGTVTPS